MGLIFELIVQISHHVTNKKNYQIFFFFCILCPKKHAKVIKFGVVGMILVDKLEQSAAPRLSTNVFHRPAL